MATHVSALKRARQSEKRRQRNYSAKSALKTYTKKVLQAVEGQDPQEAQKALARAVPALQKASAKKIIHKRTASRRISLLSRKVNALKSPA